MVGDPDHSTVQKPPLGLQLFTLVPMCAGCAVSGVFLSFAVPSMARYGFQGMWIAAAIGAVAGIWPAHWLARKIWEGLKE